MVIDIKEHLFLKFGGNMMNLDKIVTDLYTVHGITDIGDLNPISISRNLEIETHYYDEGSEALIFEGKKYIFLNKNLAIEEMWFQFCHELGHLQLHCGNQMQFLGTPADSFVSFQEMKANRFALLACAPTFILDDYKVFNMNIAKAERFVKEKCLMDEYRAVKRLREYERLHASTNGNIIYRGGETNGVIS